MGYDIGPTIGIKGETEFRNTIRQVNQTLKTLRQEEEAVTSAYDKNDKSAEKLSKQNEVLTKRIDAQKEKLRLLTKGYEDAVKELGENDVKTLKWQTTVHNATAELNKMERQLEENQNAMSGMSGETTKAASAIDVLADTLVAEKLLSGLENVADLLKSCAEASIEFESAMAGVAKTTDLSDDELNAMGDQLKKLSTQMPATAVELAGITESAGQLGIAKENLVDFTKVMANLGVATNLGAEEAATALAKFANVTKMDADNYERLGSVIVALGNNFATTEADIVSMGTRLAATGSVVGLTEAEIMALSAAMSSVGIEAEAGGSAMSKLLKKFETMVATGDKSLNEFAKIAGMTADEFSKAWEDNALEALSSFIDGLGDLDKQGGNATATMAELGLTEVRLSNAVLALAQSDGVLRKSLKLSNKAWQENNALAKEAETRYNTTESKFQMLQNAANNLKIAIGDALTPALSRLAESGAGVVEWVTEFIENNPWIVQALTALATAIGVTAGAFVVAKVAVIAFHKALEVLENTSATLKIASAIIGIISALTALSAFLRKDTAQDQIKKRNKEIADSYEDVKKAHEDAVKSIEGEEKGTYNLLTQLKQLNAVSNKTAGQKALIKSIVDELNERVPDLALHYNEEADAIDGLTDSVDQYIKKAYELKKFEEISEELFELMDQQGEAQGNLEAAQREYNAALAETERLQMELDALRQGGVDAFSDYAAPAAMYSAELTRLENELEKAQGNQSEWNDTVSESQALVDDLDTQIAELRDDLAGVGSEEENLGVLAGTVLGDKLQNSIQSLKQLQDAYNEAYNSAYESIMGQIGLFEKFDTTSKTSAGELKGNLDSQIEWMRNYSTNLTDLSNRSIEGIDRLVSILSDGSTESAAALAGLADASDAEIVDIINSLTGVDDAAGEFADSIARVATDFDDKMSELEQSALEAIDEIHSMDAEAKQAAEDVVQGLIDGVSSKSSFLYTKMVNLGNTMIDGIRRGIDAHSPSKKARVASKDLMSGLILGVEDYEKDLDSLMEDVGEKLIASFSSEASQQKAKEALNAYKSYISEYASAVKSSLDEIDAKWEDTYQQQTKMAQALSAYGDLIETRTIQWTDGTSSTFTQLADIDAQIKKIEQYGAALDALQEKGISSGLMDEVVDMNIDDAIEYANKLLSMTDEKWAAYNSAWEEKQRVAQEIAERFYKDELDALENEYNEELDKSLDSMKDTAFTSGVATVQGLIDGMESKKAALKKTADEMASIVNQAMRFSSGTNQSSGAISGISTFSATQEPIMTLAAGIENGLLKEVSSIEFEPYNQMISGINLSGSKRIDEIDRMVQSVTPIYQERDSSIARAISNVATAALNPATPAVIILKLPNSGMEFARWIINDIRSLNESDPAIVNDF